MDKALLVLQLLIEGTSIRTAERISGIRRNTVLPAALVLAGRMRKADRPLYRQCSSEGCAVR